jgi:hypothetical protein
MNTQEILSQAARPKYSMADTSPLLCKCGEKKFQEAFILRRLSMILTGDKKDTVVTVPVLFCVKCGEILEEMLPPELK